jgi:hypothetical protein
LPGDEFGSVVVKHSQQLLVVDVPESPPGLIFAKEPQMRKKLPESHVGRHRA